MSGQMDALSAIERHREEIERHRENSARLAKSYVSWHTTGWGEFVDDRVLDFGCSFVERPSFTYGYAINADGDNPDLVDGRFPRGFAFIYDWRINASGFYTGAWAGFVVETIGYQFTGGTMPSDSSDPQYVLDWSMQFEGVAIKDLPTAVLDRLDSS